MSLQHRSQMHHRKPWQCYFSAQSLTVLLLWDQIRRSGLFLKFEPIWELVCRSALSIDDYECTRCEIIHTATFRV